MWPCTYRAWLQALLLIINEVVSIRSRVPCDGTRHVCIDRDENSVIRRTGGMLVAWLRQPPPFTIGHDDGSARWS
jgi:hypothetical protein